MPDDTTEVERLRKSVADLTDALVGWRELVEEIDDENSRLRQDNAKLRELVWDMWDFFCVVLDDPHVFKEELDFSVEVWKRMRELGVEVDG